MTFIQMLKTVVNQTFNLYSPLRIDMGDGSMYKEVDKVVADKGFVIIQVRKEK